MASSYNANTPGSYEKGIARIVSPPIIKQDEGAVGNIRGIRLLFIYCLVSTIFSICRAYKIYQGFDSWVGLNHKDKFFLIWGVFSTIVMAFFIVAYVVLEYWRRQIGKKDKV